MSTTYPKFRQALLAADIDMEADTIRAQLIDLGAYTPADAHQFLTSVPAGARIGNPVTLTGKTITDGVFDAANITFAAVPAGTGTGSAIEAILIYKEGASAASSPLIGIVDRMARQVDGETVLEPMSVVPNGGNIDILWQDNGIFVIANADPEV